MTCVDVGFDDFGNVNFNDGVEVCMDIGISLHATLDVFGVVGDMASHDSTIPSSNEG